jgi:Xaa-Pro aminopeptidase
MPRSPTSRRRSTGPSAATRTADSSGHYNTNSGQPLSYTRGHFGHSLGCNLGQKEWPWISRTERRVIEPNMVLALEMPFYIDEVGGFMIELSPAV